MVKKFVTTLRNGAKEQKASILGRTVTLYDGEVVSEGILTKTFPSLFEEIIDVAVQEKSSKKSTEKSEETSVKDEEVLIENSSDVEGVVQPKPSRSRRNNK